LAHAILPCGGGGECLCSAAAKGALRLIPKTAQARHLPGTLTQTSQSNGSFSVHKELKTPKPQNPNNTPTSQDKVE